VKDIVFGITLSLFIIVGASLLLVFGTQVGWASEVRTFSWKTPTERTDGSPLPVAEIAGYTIGCSLVSGKYDALVIEVNNGAAVRHSFPADWMLVGMNYCSMNTKDKKGLVGPWADEVTWLRLPDAPTDFRRRQ
jgi:hypothetical protein